MKSTDVPHCVRYTSPSALFAEAASAYTTEPALITRESTFSFAQVADAVQRTAAGLASRGIGKGSRVALVLPRGVDQIVGVLGVLWLGGIFIPLDRSWPTARIRELLDEIRPDLVIGADSQLALNQGPPERWRVVDPAELRTDDRVSKPEHVEPDDPCYGMFTSGSTGKPKEVAIPNRGITRFVTNPAPLRFGPRRRWLYTGSPSFDGSLLEYLVPLLSGSACIVATQGSVTANDIDEMIARFDATDAFLTSSLFHMMTEAGFSGLGRLDQLVVGGETLSPLHCREHIRRHPATKLINGYGPTEASIAATVHVVSTKDTEKPGGIPIGRPIAGSALLVVDETGSVVEKGETGELIIGGVAVGLGYVNRPDLSQRRFITLAGRDGLWYRSGDLVREHADGHLEFLGRIDRQVKVRGQRIELDGIEAQAVRHAGVLRAHADVLGDHGSDRRLALMYIADESGPTERELRALMLEHLPAHEVPDIFKRVDRFPLLSNGKIDRRTAFEIMSSIGAERATPPTDISGVQSAEIPEQVARRAWNRLVSSEINGPQDNFWECGGHSLLLLRLIASIKSESGLSIDIGSFMNNPTLGGLIALLDESARSEGREAGSGIDTLCFGDGEATVLCIPGLMGHPVNFEKIARSIESASPGSVRLVALDAWGPLREENGRLDVDRTIEEVARAVRRDRPVGILAYSTGGLLPLCISTEAAEFVPGCRLWLVDTYFVSEVRSRRQKIIRGLWNSVRFPARAPTGWAEVVRDQIRSRRLHTRLGLQATSSGRFDLGNIHRLISERVAHVWTGRAHLISAGQRSIWAPHFDLGTSNGLGEFLGTTSDRTVLPLSHTEMLTRGAEELSVIITEDLSRDTRPGG